MKNYKNFSASGEINATFGKSCLLPIFNMTEINRCIVLVGNLHVNMYNINIENPAKQTKNWRPAINFMNKVYNRPFSKMAAANSK